jgi:hypothetical protein
MLSTFLKRVHQYIFLHTLWDAIKHTVFTDLVFTSGAQKPRNESASPQEHISIFILVCSCTCQRVRAARDGRVWERRRRPRLAQRHGQPFGSQPGAEGGRGWRRGKGVQHWRVPAVRLPGFTSLLNFAAQPAGHALRAIHTSPPPPPAPNSLFLCRQRTPLTQTGRGLSAGQMMRRSAFSRRCRSLVPISASFKYART